jgi:hypothetical protein
MIVTDENGVIWRCEEGRSKLKVLDPSFVHEKRDFRARNPHDEFLPHSTVVNPLWQEFEESVNLDVYLAGAIAFILTLLIGTIVLVSGSELIG